ncbi:probable aspartyl aminopeptidase isoform X2 [Eurytemora carolleeae]|uniref:probable aspartyl aminopeptidase isoform X2 n=1 Tax=Eurytemora carolleeae TaxID=1294199 RepID=UPI000C77C16C|nr:probable aspartyl aminopeptidase isoform X2 [Eurytemora carolleeae]|eukprot:XP_023343173.1 probable aspartyl aminopeptidase isoform X2 [Eurytemora affinis]
MEMIHFDFSVWVNGRQLNRETRFNMAAAKDLLSFVDASPTPFHVVAKAESVLETAGFKQLNERDVWKGQVQVGGKYFYHRNRSTLVAFAVGDKYVPGNEFKVIGAHTDSPVLKVKPVSNRTSNGYLQVGVECYGGGLWHTWFDRDLTLAGCVIIEKEGAFTRELVNLKRPLLRVPNLCIHLQSSEERSSFTVNKENHLQPILAMVESTLNQKDEGQHSSVLLELLAGELGVQVDQIKDMELTLTDTQPGATWGPKNEFLSSPRLDNQVHCFTGLSALLEHSKDLSNDTGVSMLACFDHEEIGSDSAQGAGSPVMSDGLSRVLGCFDSSDETLKITIRNSFMISADVAHAIHPNYSEKHEKKHQPKLNQGTVIKTNSNQRYATNSETGFLLRELARRAVVPVQEFVVRNDCPCGSTIGPIVSAKTGIRTVDLGIASLSMHSIRETIGCDDIETNIRLFSTFYSGFGELDKSCSFN